MYRTFALKLEQNVS